MNINDVHNVGEMYAFVLQLENSKENGELALGDHVCKIKKAENSKVTLNEIRQKFDQVTRSNIQSFSTRKHKNQTIEAIIRFFEGQENPIEIKSFFCKIVQIELYQILLAYKEISDDFMTVEEAVKDLFKLDEELLSNKVNEEKRKNIQKKINGYIIVYSSHLAKIKKLMDRFESIDSDELKKFPYFQKLKESIKKEYPFIMKYCSENYRFERRGRGNAEVIETTEKTRKRGIDQE